MERVILHVDMDAFFASVEQRDHPEYQGKPVIVGADPKEGKGRGVVSTCSYEAREFGVHSALPISQAYKLCPQGIYVPPNGKLYGQVSKGIFEVFYEFTDAVEPLSIDEAFLDVTGSQKLFGNGVEIARQIKKRIIEKERISASVGVAPNKYLAKIASDLEKPDGLVVVPKDRIKEFLQPLDISRLWGAGIRTQEVLRKMNIHTIGDLAAFPRDILDNKFGKMGANFYNLAHGIDERPVVAGEGVKSVSNEHTFGRDINDPEELLKTLLWLSEKVGYRLRLKKLKGKTIHLKMRYDNFTTLTRNKTLQEWTDNTQTLYETCAALFKHNYQEGRKIRLLGVGISGFGLAQTQQLSLFGTSDKKSEKLDQVQDLLAKRFGRKIISRADTMPPQKKS